MIIEQLYTKCLSEMAYYIESGGEAAIIDPLRETTPYLDKLRKNGARLKYIFETHFHADFVSGHVDLAEITGATIIYGPYAETGYNAHIGKDGEIFKIGKISIRLLHTPGHTMESSCFLLQDEKGKNTTIFTGDTLFIGDVGRPDLAVSSNVNKEDLAGMLYDSLHEKILPLEDELIIYPAHGSGSACGKSMSKETFDTLGSQKKGNYALQPMSKQAFIEKVTEGILPPPQYFAKNAQMNQKGYGSFDEVIAKGNQPLSLKRFLELAENGSLILDARDQQEFAKGYIPGSINMGLDGTFAVWVGTLIKNINQSIILVAPGGREEETVMRLSRVGYDHTLGFLSGGFETYKNSGKPVETIRLISPSEFEKIALQHKINILDVRRTNEYDTLHLIGSENMPLEFIEENVEKLDKKKTYYIHCQAGYRSMVFSSILKKKGFENVVDIAGGFNAIKETRIPVT